MEKKRPRFFGNVSIHTRMLLIIVPLIVVPMLILAIVGFLAASGEAAKTSTRYLKQRENDLRTIAENLPIRDYYFNQALWPHGRSRGLSAWAGALPQTVCGPE